MKKTAGLLLFLLSFFTAMANPSIDKIEPPFWWTGMENDTLQLMVYGHDIATTTPALTYPGVKIAETVVPDSPNYLFVYLTIAPDTRPGTVKITFSAPGKKALIADYELKERKPGMKNHGGFDASDVLYLIMPDRFARGKSNYKTAPRDTLAYPSRVNRGNPNARHGGNIAGMNDRLGYLDSLGITAVWVNPVQVNDMPGGSYHGYATTDYYNIDPRFGTTEEWVEFVDNSHRRDIKVVMDMIFNHSGSNHEWFKDMPFKNWYNFPDTFVQTNYRLSTLHDPYVSDYDLSRTVDGWFVRSMPDLNQRNPHLMKYLIQNSIWWIEHTGIDGIRMDTYPYADFHGMAGWIDAVEKEYPNFNIVGECWYGNEGGEAFWQRGSKVNPLGDPRLPTVMDFVLAIKARNAFSSQTDRLSGLNEIYDHLSLDYLFPDPSKILTFLDNHDTDRFLLEEPENLGWWKQAMTFLLTSRGIPQIYYGTEILMNGSREGSDGYVRRDMPGGFPGDSISVFTAEGRTPIQNEAFDFLSTLLNWRKGNDIVARGSLKHFMPESGIYVYRRALGDKHVTVIMNGNDSEITASMAPTVEIMPSGTKLRDMLSGEIIEIMPEMTFGPRAIYILEN